MPLIIDFPVTLPVGVRAHTNWGSIMHGMLMEKFSPDMAEELHKSELKPFSQHLNINKDGNTTWRLTGLNNEMEKFLKDLSKNYIKEKWRLKQKGFDIILGEPTFVLDKSYKQIADESFLSETPKRKIKFVFKTPSTFKKDGEYVLYPTASLIIKSLYAKWDSFTNGLRLDDPEVREHLEKHIKIIGYNLKTSSFDLNGISVMGFYGQTILSIKGPEALVKLTNMIIEFGKFSGIGIKTALGMGGLDIE